MTLSQREFDRHEEWLLKHNQTIQEMQGRLEMLKQAMLETAAALREAGIHRGGSWSLPSPSEDSVPPSQSADLDLGRVPHEPYYFVE